MDRMLYVSMSGAKETLKAQAANNHNLANASTTGFRADMAAFQARQVVGSGFDSRVYATTSTTGFDSSSGSMQSTGRDLDVAVQGNGYIAVQGRDGREAYTRAGDLRVDPQGQLRTATGLPVMGDGGPISVPPNTSLLIGGDGTLSVVPQGSGPETRAVVGRIKLVDPPEAQVTRGPDGLFHLRNGTDAPSSATVRLTSGVLEGSNVNVADAMVNMIELARRFDLQVKAMRTAEDNGAASAQLLKNG
jgi:flagellar basal-body rod protein FlgF